MTSQTRPRVVGFFMVALVVALVWPSASARAASIWGSTIPVSPPFNDSAASEVGLKFRSDVNGQVTGIRFYKGSGNNGQHVGHLWTTSGSLLSTATFTGESSMGWQVATLSPAVNIAAGTTYVASYFAPQGHYMYDAQGLAGPVDVGVLHALPGATYGGNGVYADAAPWFPGTASPGNGNYWVDVVFTPPAGATVATSLWNTTDLPATPASADTAGVEVGMKFKSDLAGQIYGLKFYKGPTNTGTHVGNLWASTGGSALASAPSFPNETASGWQQALFATPVKITANTTYVVSYYAPGGHYAFNAGGLASGVDKAPLHALAGSTNGGNGVFKYGASSQFPTDTSGNSNYWVDVLFAPCSSAISCENARLGTPPNVWDIPAGDGGSPYIQGFATDISVNVGGTVHFKVNTNVSNTIANRYRIDIYRLGYYRGDGARYVQTIFPDPLVQPDCGVVDSTTRLVDCSNWQESASWGVPPQLISGVYLAVLKLLDGASGVSHIPFVVRNDASISNILYQTSDTTWAAYNDFAGSISSNNPPNIITGGNSLYGGPGGRAYKVSYNRPLTLRGSDRITNFFADEFPMIRWLEANGFDVSYTTGVDVDRGDIRFLKQHKVFVSSGHDEYWSNTQRSNIEVARDAGVNLAFFSGNEVFWKTRWENSNRTLVCYKETNGDAVDPTLAWTGTWRDPTGYPATPDGARPENALTGTISTVNNDFDVNNAAIVVSPEEGKMRFWKNTAFASNGGQTVPGIIGYEWDEDLDDGVRPVGLIRLSTTTIVMSRRAKRYDYGFTDLPGSATHSLTLYKAQSGALVFGSGTVRWSWGLDGTHDRTVASPLVPYDDGASTPDPAIQQATVNLLADMSAQPTTLQAGLKIGAKSTDITAPQTTITFPASNAQVNGDTLVTIRGTASDSGGGQVGGVEVSTDGSTWHRATGRTNWTYAWTVRCLAGNVTIRARATDDSGNRVVAGVSQTVRVTDAVPCSLWSNASTPTNASTTDTTPVEVGVKFKSDVAGRVMGVRFYNGSSNTGQRVGHLWANTGGPALATVNFPINTASGWQVALFPSPVNISAGTTYIISYFAPLGQYAYDYSYFLFGGTDTPPLHALPNGSFPNAPPGERNGVYKDFGGFPDQTYLAANYWVDVIFMQ